mgnify:CR=1 FL=1
MSCFLLREKSVTEIFEVWLYVKFFNQVARMKSKALNEKRLKNENPISGKLPSSASLFLIFRKTMEIFNTITLEKA